MSKPWPPPPDLDSLKELFASADIEGLIADDCPIDEYDPEAKHFFTAIEGYATSKLTVEHTLPLLEELWVKQFSLDDEGLAHRRPALQSLAKQVERFFGPESKPQVRNV
jgi:hypothetical protein